MTAFTPKQEDFATLPARPPLHGRQRPSLSYWQDAWRRLRKDHKAALSLYMIIALLAMTLFGPLVWRADPSREDLDVISYLPTLHIPALIVADRVQWSGVQADPATLVPANPDAGQPLAAPAALRVEGAATTQYVRLSWQSVAGAAFYLVYRNDHAPETGDDLGLPLYQTLSAEELSYEDSLQLKPQDYWYTVLASDGVQEATAVVTVRVPVQRALTVSQAQERGLVAVQGQTVSLGAHPFGTDSLGRDLLARIMEGARVSLFIGIVAPLLFVLLGTIYGGISGYFGGTVDAVMMRVTDFLVALPFLLFMILFRIAFGIGPGENGILPMLIALVLLSWENTARLVRGQVLQLREEAYVQAGLLLGAKPLYLIFRHIIPNTIGPLLVNLTFSIPMAIFTEAFLSFIGMGVAAPTSSWGSMSNDGIKTMVNTPHELLFPALFISVTVLAFNLLGDGLRDALDTRMRSRE
ncbi:MAG TPA: ABC transporter permease [Candidatus Acidoferrum sp.]|nr:ABC transporter permease [Candidatus Acidoferrum sp.]